MNPSTKADFTTATDSPLLKDNLCEVCSGTSEEDLYIVFNVLYRIVVGDNFYETSLQREKGTILDPMFTHTDENADKYMQTIQENLSEFRKKLCSQELVEIAGLPRFDHLLREIFKSKYNRLQETVCKHKELARNFIKKFNLRTDVFFEESDFNKTKLNENTERIDVVYNSVKQFKSEIESYHDQINGLSDKVLQKLLSKRSGSRPLKNQDERRESTEPKEKELFNPFVNKRAKGDKEMEDYKPSSLKNRRVTSSTNSRESREITPDFQDLKGNASKMAVFKSKLPKRATDVLKDWFLSNIKNPYPHHEAKEMLSKATGLTRKQIQNWFTNSRKRFLEPLKKKIEGKDSKETTRQPKGPLPALSLLPNVQQDEPVINIAVPQSLLLSQNTQNLQTILKPTAISPNFQSIAEVATPRALELEKNLLQSPFIPQNISIPRTLPTMAVQPTNNIMVLPMNGAQAIYQFNPNMLSMNQPQMIQVPQNAFINGFPLMQASAVSPFPYFQPVQANPNVNEAMRQQILNQFTPMNAQMYPTMQNIAISHQERSPHINNFMPFANQAFINPGANMNNSLPDFLRKK